MKHSSSDVFGLTAGDRVLVVAPHPDDETLGCGGTLARLTDADVAVYVLAVTAGPVHRHGDMTADPTVRIAEFERACDALGITAGCVGWIDDTGDLDITSRQRALVTLIETDAEICLATVRPAGLLIPAGGAFHQDHQAVHRAGIAAARPHSSDGQEPTALRVVVGFRGVEDHGWPPFAGPGWPLHVDVTDTWTSKEKALRCYPSQIPEDHHPRSITRIRAVDAAAGGALSVGYAETFIPYRLAY